MANNQDNLPPRPDEKEEFDWKKNIRPVFVIGLIMILMFLLWQNYFTKSLETEKEISYTTFQTYVENGDVAKGDVLIRSKSVYRFNGTLKTEKIYDDGRGNEIKTKKFFTILPYVDKSMEEWWKSKDIAIKYVHENDDWTVVLFNLFPWIIFAIFAVYMLRRVSGGGGNNRGIFSFGKSRARLVDPTKNKITFADVAGADEAKEELEEVVEFLKAPQKFTSLGGKVPKGVLLVGPPGTGKTLLARAVAGEADVPFFSISGADFVEMFVGVGASRVRDLFDQGRKNKPCIIFIDELDAVGRQRGAGLGGGHDEREQTLNQLLVEMDGFEHSDGVILIAATNRPDVLDSALMRPGRFDRQVVVGMPDIRGRLGILKVHTKKIQLAKDVDLSIIAKGTPGSSGADLANIVNEAALLAARNNHKKVNMSDFEEARDKVFMGPERKSLIMSDHDKKVIAYHEAGHALVSELCEHAEPVHKVTIIPRGMALGVTFSLPSEDKYNYPKEYYLDRITVLLGGRVAEMHTFKTGTTGASNDIERATKIARKMVTEWGMSDKLGTLQFGTNEDEVFLGREISQNRNFSEHTAQLIDDEISAMVKNCYHQAEKLIRENDAGLKALADKLLEVETIHSEEINEILRGAGVNIPEKAPEIRFAEKLVKKRGGRGRRKKTDEKAAPAGENNSKDE
jgi:cell division protease FtsH